jgi:aminopeptidase N
MRGMMSSEAARRVGRECRRGLRALPACLALVTAAAGTLAAQGAGARRVVSRASGWRANEAYQRSHDYDLVHQTIALGSFDWDSTSLRGRVQTTLRSLRPGLDSVVLDAGRGMEVGAVTTPSGRPLRWRHPGDTLVVYPARSADLGDTVRFRVDYRVRVRNGRGLTFLEAEPDHPRQLWSQGESQNNHLWFPTYDFPNDKMTWELSANVPVGYTVVSNGRRVGDRDEGDGTHTVTWRQEHPASTYLVSLVISRLTRLRDAWRGRPVDYYVYPADTARARRLFRVTPDMIEAYSRLTGVPYPWPQYAQTTVADFFGGMENVTATTLVDWLPDERAYRDDPWFLTHLIPHELAHMWFGDYVTAADWANLWLNEGFAEFMPGQYWAGARGPGAAEAYYLEEYDEFVDADARRRVPLAGPGSNVMYSKGALVLRMLEKLLEPERFWSSVHEYLTRHAYANATTDDFRQAILAATGQNLAWFFDQWVYGAGYPRLRVDARWDSAGGRLAMIVRQVQADSADSARAMVTPRVFRMPVRVRVSMPDSAITRRVVVDRAVDTVVVQGVDRAPDGVVFDDENAVVKALEFPQPTAWLAAELASSTALWNRRWAADRLAVRTADPVAGAALAGILSGAGPAVLRAAAADDLARFPSSVALPPLEAALSDSSALVRAAAVRALGHLGGAAADRLARRSFETDSSYGVRAAALVAVARSDSADPSSVRDLLKAGLRAPSYRDAVAQAAMMGIVMRRDTSFVGELVAMLPRSPVAAQALGALGAAGDARALGVLVDRLADPDRRVRRAVLQALTTTVPPGVARRLLEAARADLRDASVRRAVDAALERLGHGSRPGGGE